MVYIKNIRPIITLLCILSGISLCAQSSKAPTEAERKAINKAVNTIVPFIDSFENSDWQKKDGGAIEEQYYTVQRNPSAEMGTAPFNDWQFSIRPGSNLWNKYVQPYLDKTQNLSAGDAQTIALAQKEGQKLTQLKNIFIEVHVNDILLPFNLQKSTNNHGSYYEYRQTPDAFIGIDHNLNTSYVLAFGNWQNAKYNATNKTAYFHFMHPAATPYIENIVIIISGNEERIKELISTANWSEINNALTP